MNRSISASLAGLKHLVGAAAVVLATLAGTVTPAGATLTINITQGIEDAAPIAVVPFGWEGEGTVPLDVAALVDGNLARSGTFRTLPRADMLARPNAAEQISYQDWRILGMENLVIGRVRSTGPDRYTVQFQLFDVFRERQLAGYSFPVAGADLRRLAHHISDLIYEALTGVRGVFSTRIAYVVARSGPDGKPQYSLQVADADGFNPQVVVSSAEPLMSPAWSPDGSRLAYVSFEKRRPTIFIQELSSGARQRIAGFKGINGAPAFSPDGRRLAMTLSKGGNPDVWLYDFASGKFTQLTRHYAIDTEPAWSPDGRSLIFTSDRGGKPQLYRVAADGGKATRVTFDGEYNARGRFSADGKQVTMVHGSGGRYSIGLLDLEKGYFDVLTDGRLDESPSFAPNGRMIIYATQEGGKATLAAVSVDGRVRQRLHQADGEVREPVWSPFDR